MTHKEQVRYFLTISEEKIRDIEAAGYTFESALQFSLTRSDKFVSENNMTIEEGENLNLNLIVSLRFVDSEVVQYCIYYQFLRDNRLNFTVIVYGPEDKDNVGFVETLEVQLKGETLVDLVMRYKSDPTTENLYNIINRMTSGKITLKETLGRDMNSIESKTKFFERVINQKKLKETSEILFVD